MKIARNTLGAGVRPAAAGKTTTKRSGWLLAGIVLTGLLGAAPAEAASLTGDSRLDGVTLTVDANPSKNCSFVAEGYGPGQSQYQTDIWSGTGATANAIFDSSGLVVSVSVSVSSPSATTYSIPLLVDVTGDAAQSVALTLDQNDIDVFADAEALCKQSQPPTPPFPPGGPTGPTGPLPGGGSGGTVPTTLSISPDGGPAEVGTPVGLSFIVDAGGASAVGSVQLYVDDIAYGDPADVFMNFTSIDVTFGSTGNKVVKAVYSGDSTFAGSSVTKTFSVTAAPPANKAPGITTGSTVTVAENTTYVVDVEATDDTDRESSGLTYSISGGKDSALFTINSGSGALSFIAAPDFESPADDGRNNVYNVEVTVTDSGFEAAMLALAVTVTDVVETPPNKAPTITTNGTVSLNENTTTVVNVDATDDSDSEGSGLTYSISGGKDSALFTINSGSGALAFIAAPDFEAPADTNGDNVYEVEVMVSDSGLLTNKQRFAVTVTDVVEVAPNKAPSITTGATATVSENTTYVVDVDATDDTDAEGNGLTYSISGGKDSALFTINSGSGALAFIAAPDFESPADDGRNNVYDVEIAVTDLGLLTSKLMMAITVTDVAETVPDAPTTVSLTSSKNPSIDGDSLTFTATVLDDKSKPAIGTVTFFDGKTELGSGPLVNGVAQLTTTSLSVATHDIVAEFRGAGYVSSSQSLSQVVGAASPKTSSISFGNIDEDFVTVEVMGSVPNVHPTGSVTLFDNGSSVGTESLSNGRAFFLWSPSKGGHSLEARYSGGDGFPASSGTAWYNIIVRTKLSLSSSASPAFLGEPVTLTATVNTFGAGDASGSVEFTEGRTVLGTATVNGNVATLELTNLSLGVHSIEAEFSDRTSAFDSSYAPAIYQEIVKPKDIDTALTLASSANPGKVGETVTFTATVLDGDGNPVSGNVTFAIRGTDVGSVPLQNGVATYSTSDLSEGSNAIYAVFENTGYSRASNAISQVMEAAVKPAPVVTALSLSTSAPGGATAGETVTLTASVTSERQGVAEGVVVFSEGNIVLGSAQLVNGSAELYINSLSVGSHTISAAFSGEGFVDSKGAVDQRILAGTAPKLKSYVDATLASKTLNKPIQVNVKVEGAFGLLKPTGQVVITVDGKEAVSGRLTSSGRATLKAKVKLKVGQTIRVNYLGDSRYLPASDIISVKTAAARKHPDITLSSSQMSPQAGSLLKLTASVGYDGVPLEGYVEFTGEGAPGDPVPVIDGEASVDITAPGEGTHEYFAHFTPDDGEFDEAEASVELTVPSSAPAEPVVSVVTSPNPSLPGEKVTINVTSTEMSGEIRLMIRDGDRYGRIWRVSGDLVDGKASLEFTFDAADTYGIEGWVGDSWVEGVSHEVQSAVQQSSSHTFKVQQVAIATGLEIFDNPDFTFSVDPPEADAELAFFPDRLAFNASLWAIQEAAGAQKRGAFNVWLGGKAGTISSSDVNGWTVSGALGADYMFSPQLIGGLGLMFDRVTIKDRNGTDTIGNGWIATPYLKGNITDSLAYKLQAGYGRVTNEVTPLGATYTDVINGDRKVFSGSLVGTIQVGDYTINPSGSVTYFDQTMEAFTDGQGNAIPSMSMGTVTVTLSPAISRRFDLDGMALTLGGNLQLAASASNDGAGWAFSGLRDGAGISLSLALPGGATFRADAGVGGVVLGDAFTTRGSISLTANIN